MACITIITAMLNHVSDSCFHAIDVNCQLDHVLILFDAFLLKISFVDVLVEDDLKEILQPHSGILDIFKYNETR